MSRRLLISYAHPDDESFGLGGLIARYVAEGVEVSLICATNGDVGTVRPEFLEGHDSVASLRLAELDCAAEKLSLRHVVKLGYKDSGMMGSETSNDPACLWQAPVEDVTRRVVEVIRELNSLSCRHIRNYKLTGISCSYMSFTRTTQAFPLAGDQNYVTVQSPYAPQKLYYSGISTRQIRAGIALTRLRGQDPRRLGRNKDFDLVAILDHVEPTHTTIDIRNYFTAWDEASACHASQLGGGGPRFPLWLRRVISPYQSFTRVYPKPSGNRVDERDFFTNVRVDDPVTT